MANRNWANGGRQYSMHIKPVLIDCNFVVAATDTGGLGITSLKGPAVQNVFMHTSSTPGAGNSNPATPNVTITNPNPASGTIVVQLQDNYNRILGYSWSILGQPNGTPVAITAASTNLTAGVAYTITTLGDATAADWLAVGVPKGVTPALNVAFIAIATGAGTGTTARVAPTAAGGSGIFSIEKVSLTLQGGALHPNPTSAQGFGAQLIFQCRKDSSSDAPVIAAPADGTLIGLQLYLNDSSITVQGE